MPDPTNIGLESKVMWRRRTLLLVLAVPLISVLLFSRSEHLAKRATFHVEGRITSPWDSVFSGAVPRSKITFDGEQALEVVTSDSRDSYVRVPRTEITFRNATTTKTVVADRRGFYKVDLPLGFYHLTTTTATVFSQPLTTYERIFEVLAPTSLTFNGTLYSASTNCDTTLPADVAQEVWKDVCGGQDSFQIPSRDLKPLEMTVRYLRRHRTERTYIYDNKGLPDKMGPVFVAYNLFTLEARKVSFNERTRVIEATGNVVVTDPSGATRYADALSFKIQNDSAVELPHQPGSDT